MKQDLRTLIDTRDMYIQKSRVAFSNRLQAIEDGRDQADDYSKSLIESWVKRLQTLEDYIDEDIKRLAETEAIIDNLIDIKGISFTLAAKLVSMIDIAKAPTISALWKYAGYSVEDGKAERPVKGQKLEYNKRLRVACYLVATSFLRCNSPYRKIYDESKEYYQTNRPDWDKKGVKLHIHLAATRKMMKVFLSHLWLVWREKEGLPTSKPYVIDIMKHAKFITPEEMGWKYKIGGLENENTI